MTTIKNILILMIIAGSAIFLVFGTFVFGKNSELNSRIPGVHNIKKSIVKIAVNQKGEETLDYSSYKSGSIGSGVVYLDFGRLSTAFISQNTGSYISFISQNTGSTKAFSGLNLQFENIQGIISLYDPFSIYSLAPKNHTYKIDQITNGSFYVSDEPDGTVSLYSIDAVIKLTFFYDKNIMTDMILFPGMYIKFDPQANNLLKGADLFKIMLALSDVNNPKVTGIEFVNPRVSDGEGNDILFMYKLPITTKPLFQMLNVLFGYRIAQVENLKKYATSTSYSGPEINSLIYNPSKKNFYLLKDLKSILSLATQKQMDTKEFSRKIKNIYTESKLLVDGNSVSTTLEGFLNDTRFALFGKNSNPSFKEIYDTTADILEIKPSSSKGIFFQYLSDIYSRNIALPKRDSSFSSIDTYTPIAAELLRTVKNDNSGVIEPKDYFDIALYAYQLLQKAQKTQNSQFLTDESLQSKATYDLMETIFLATEIYVEGLPINDRKVAYQTLAIQFYLPITDTLTRTLFNKFITTKDQKIFLDNQYLDGDKIKFEEPLRENIYSSYSIFQNTYDIISQLYGDEGKPDSVLLFRDSVIRINGFIEMIKEGNYREYRSSPYFGIDVDGIFLPDVNLDGKIEIYNTTLSNKD